MLSKQLALLIEYRLHGYRCSYANVSWIKLLTNTGSETIHTSIKEKCNTHNRSTWLKTTVQVYQQISKTVDKVNAYHLQKKDKLNSGRYVERYTRMLPKIFSIPNYHNMRTFVYYSCLMYSVQNRVQSLRRMNQLIKPSHQPSDKISR